MVWQTGQKDIEGKTIKKVVIIHFFINMLKPLLKLYISSIKNLFIILIKWKTVFHSSSVSGLVKPWFQLTTVG